MHNSVQQMQIRKQTNNQQFELTPITTAIKYSGNSRIFCLLLRHGAQITQEGLDLLKSSHTASSEHGFQGRTSSWYLIYKRVQLMLVLTRPGSLSLTNPHGTKRKTSPLRILPIDVLRSLPSFLFPIVVG